MIWSALVTLDIQALSNPAVSHWNDRLTSTRAEMSQDV
jgi:hypothetical protein